MLAAIRHQMIKDILIESKSITVSDLATKFEVSEETIRRDLKTLEKTGFLTRTYGGAFIQEGVMNEILFSLRESNHVESKEIIARQCKKIVHDGESIFLDASTTSVCIAEELKGMRLTILTDSHKVASTLLNAEGIQLIVTGGEFSPRSMSYISSGAIRAIQNYFVDKAFISCRSVSIEHGITDSNEELADIRRLAIQRSKMSFLVADYSKFDNTSFTQICELDQISGVITDRPLNERWYAALEKFKIIVFDTSNYIAI